MISDNLYEFAVTNLKAFGVSHVGIATTESLAGGPPSADLTYMMPAAKSAVVFAFPFDQDLIPDFLQKKDRRAFEQDYYRMNVVAAGMAMWAAQEIKQLGFDAVPVLPNNSYRKDTPGGILDMHPDISLRYLAVRSGIGFFGLSGNLLTKEYGAHVVLGAVITDAEMPPTDPLPDDDNYCDNCRLCMAACPSGLVDPRETTTVTLGEYSFEYPKRRSIHRCNFVCGGFSGLHKSGKWSTWSPGRFPIPEDDEGFTTALASHLGDYANRPVMEGGYFNSVMPTAKIYQTCGNCQVICHPDKDVRKARYKMLKESGVVVQHPNGRLEAMSPADAKAFIDDMPPERRRLYEAADSGQYRTTG